MLLKSLRMKNFRQYRGEQLVAFSCDKDHNVTIILGNNTSGKTTLLQAFNWCLYGVAVFETADFILNLDVASEMNIGDEENVEVEIILIHNNTEYVISRSQKYTCDSRGARPTPINSPRISYKRPDGQTEPIKQIYAKRTINEILPEDLSSYFFFDTERIEHISSKKDVTEAVRGLLGLSVLDNAMKHLGSKSRKKSVIGRYNASMDLEGNQKAAEALKRMQSEQAKHSALAAKLSNVRSEVAHYQQRKEQLDEILRDNQSTADLQIRKENLERQITVETRALNNACNGFIEAFNTNTTNFFAQPLMARAYSVLQEAQVDDKGIRDMNAHSIDDIIKRGRCVCGTEVIKGNPAYDQLMKEREFLPPQSIGIIIRNFREKIDTYASTNRVYYKQLEDRYKEIFRCKSRIQEWNDEVNEISEQIEGKKDMKKYEEELLDVKKRLKDFKDRKELLIREDECCSREIDHHQKVYDSLVAISDKNRQIMTYISYAEEIYNWIEDTYCEKEIVIREKLEGKVNNIFSKMYHGRRKVAIDEKYRVTLLTALADDEIKTDESKGLETVKNFAFITGLVDLAREKIISKAGDTSMELSSEPYPLVMDAPFSNADEKHVSNISRVLPEVAEQVIMFIMSKDWSFAEVVMGHYVGKKYYLDKKSETLTFIKESEK